MKENKLIELKGISKEFDGVTILHSIDLYIRDKEFVTLLGPSGCGKTTILRCIAGFETPDEGKITFEGKDLRRGRGALEGKDSRKDRRRETSPSAPCHP